MREPVGPKHRRWSTQSQNLRMPECAGMSPEASADDLQLGGGWGSVDSGDISTDQLCGLLVDATLAAVRVALLKMRKRGR
jgi:hypothetical protein